jgi:periplasmic divalent cation tolerance protein
MPPDERVTLILTTEADSDSARALASELVDRRVAACVTMSTVQSTYRWEGETVDTTEVQLVLKTSPDTVAAAIAAIEALHSYEVPEIVVLDTRASRAYATWVGDVVSP